MDRLRIDTLGNCLDCGRKVETTSACCHCQNWDIKIINGVGVWTQKPIDVSEVVQTGEIKNPY